MSNVIGISLDVTYGDLVADCEHIKLLVYQHQIIRVDDISLSPMQFIKLAETYGSIVCSPNAHGKPGLDGFGQILKISNRPDQGFVPTADFWHADQSWCSNNPNLTFFYSVCVPQQGGETRFADTRRAHQDLSQDIKSLLQGKIAYYRHNKTHIKSANYPSHTGLNETNSSIDAYHEIAPVHPFTGRASLYDPMGHCSHIMDMPESDSLDLLDLLRQHVTMESYIYTHHYRPNQLIFWDNTSLIHSAPVPKAEFARELWQLRVRDEIFFDKKIGTEVPIAILDHKA